MSFLRALLAGALLGIGGAHAADLRVGLAADVTSMDPHFLNILPNINIGWHVFDALTHVDADARLIPGLAVSWRSLDATTWEFKLRRGVRFHDGSELTAADVAFSIERTLEVPNGQYRTFTQRIVAKEIPDPYTLRLKTAAPYAMVPYDLDSVFIVSKKAARRAPRGLRLGQGHDRHRAVPLRALLPRGSRRARAERELLGRGSALGQGRVPHRAHRSRAPGGPALRGPRHHRAGPHRRPAARPAGREAGDRPKSLLAHDFFPSRPGKRPAARRHRQGRQAARAQPVPRSAGAARALDGARPPPHRRAPHGRRGAARVEPRVT